MLVICSNCNARLQLDESKMPSQAFKARCPKCQSSIEIKSEAPADADPAGDALLAETMPSPPQISPFERPPVAAPFKPAGTATTAVSNQPATGAANDVVELLADLLRHKETPRTANTKRPAWDHRRALVCTEPVHRESVATGLAAQDYEVFVAGNTAEALGRMREDHIDVLVLDAAFDPVDQGFAFVMREIKLMRSVQRRRLFLVYLTPNVRTMDLHAAFLHNVNLIVNPADVEQLPEAVDLSLEHYNELYREFNRAMELPAI